jgi:SAM-dependent methyltransferase
MGLKTIVKNLYNLFNKSSRIQKTFYVLAIIFIITLFTNYNVKEGFTDNDGTVGISVENKFETKEGVQLYDNFYANVYDDLVFSKMKDDFEIGEIINGTHPSSESRILDIGSGTGHHVSNFNANGYNVIGVDISPAMVSKANKNYPELEFKQGDVLDTMIFSGNSFTHITCFYFTIYYIQNKRLFFENCIHWLKPGGYLAVHMVDRDKFDPILPAGDPFGIVSPQKYSKTRITSTIVKFNGYDYKSVFDIKNDENGTDSSNASLQETFKNKKNGKVRKNEHKFYMPTQKDILAISKSVGFILIAKIDMIKCQYSNQYIYILQKPT